MTTMMVPSSASMMFFSSTARKDLFLQDLGQGVGPPVGVPQAVGDSGPYPVNHAEEHDGDELLLENDLHLHVVEHHSTRG